MHTPSFANPPWFTLLFTFFFFQISWEGRQPLVTVGYQDVLAMQDTMHPASETFQSTSRVARYLVDQELPWLEGAPCFCFLGGKGGRRIKAQVSFFKYIYIYIYIYIDVIWYMFFLTGNPLFWGGFIPCLFARGICTMFVIDWYHPHAWLVALMEINRWLRCFVVFRCKRNSGPFCDELKHFRSEA